MNCAQSAAFLRKVAVSNAEVSAIGTGVSELVQGIAYFLIGEWIVAGYWDSVGFCYFDVLISPEGEVGCYSDWMQEGGGPEDRLASNEFAWLWGLLERAPAIPWTPDLKHRVREAYREVIALDRGRPSAP